jgi:hypothetical protein
MPLGVPSTSEQRPAPAPTLRRVDAGLPVPSTTSRQPPATTTPGPAAFNDRPLHMREDRDDMIGEDDETPRPASIKPDAGILYDAGAPLPPIPDAGPLPNVRDAGQPM